MVVWSLCYDTILDSIRFHHESSSSRTTKKCEVFFFFFEHGILDIEQYENVDLLI